MNFLNKTTILFFCLVIIGFLGFCVIQAKAADEPPSELYVRTTPEGAKVLMDGKELGVSPGLFPVKPGDYKIIIDLEGYQPAEQQINVRDGRITRIELTLKPRAKSDKSEKDSLDAPKAEPDSKVIEGVGWGAFRVGATREELVKALGPPDPNLNPGNKRVGWIARHHIDCIFDQNEHAVEIRFIEGYELPLASGVKIGSSEKEVLLAYGAPDRVVNQPSAKMLEYDDRGVLMWITDGKVISFTVFRVRKMGEQETAQTPSTNSPAANASASKVIEGVGWGAFRIGATREELVKAFGEPETNPNPQDPWMHWSSRHHVDCLLSEVFKASAIQFTEGFELPLASGIKIGSLEKDVLETYSKPEQVVDKGPAKQFRYPARGVFLYIMNGKVSSFMVVKPVESESQALNILKNPGFESGDKTPDEWKKGAAIQGVKYSWDKKVASEGKASLCIEKTAQRYFPIAQWSQTVQREGDKPVILVSAQVKAKNVTKAVLDVLFLDAQDNWISHQWIAYIGAKEDGDPPANHDWKEYSGKADIPPNTAKICIGLQDYGPGKVWFDDVKADYSE